MFVKLLRVTTVFYHRGDKKKQTKTKQMFYELLEVGFVRITEHTVSDLDSICTVKTRKGQSLSVGLSVAFSIVSEFTDPELINNNQAN